MTKFSPEDRARIMAASRAALRVADAALAGDPPVEPPSEQDDLAMALAVPVEGELAKWQREAAEQDQRAARQSARRLTDHEAHGLEGRLRASIDERVAAAVDAAICAEREYVLSVITGVIAEIRAEAADELERSVRSLSLETGELRLALGELRLLLATDKGHGLVVDIPNPISPRRTN